MVIKEIALPRRFDCILFCRKASLVNNLALDCTSIAHQQHLRLLYICVLECVERRVSIMLFSVHRLLGNRTIHAQKEMNGNLLGSSGMLVEQFHLILSCLLSIL